MRCCEIDKGFIRTVPFYLKISELICCIPIWICASVGFPLFGGGVFINFNTSISFIETIILFFLYLFAKIQILPGPWVLIEVISILLSALFFLISMIIAVCNYWSSSAIAAAVFCGIEAIIYLVEFFFRFKVMRVQGFQFSAHMRSSETTTTANENTETGPAAAGPYVIGA